MGGFQLRIREKGREVLRRWLASDGMRRLRASLPARAICRVGSACGSNPLPAQLLLLFCYRGLLDLLYVSVISPVYEYTGMLADPQPLEYACSWLVLLAAAPAILKLQQGPKASSFLVTFLHYLYFIPLTSYCGCKGGTILFFGCAVLYWGILLLLQFKVPSLVLAPASAHHTDAVFRVLTLFSVLFILFISGKYTGFRITLNLDYTNIYAIRAEAAGYQIPTVFQYVLSVMPILLPVVLLYWMNRKKRLMALFLCFIFLLLFSIGAHKSIFFFFFVILTSYFLYRPWMLRWMPGLFSLLAGVGILEYRVRGSYQIAALLDRVFYIPVQISEQSAALFQDHPLNLFRFGIIGKFGFSNIYSTTIPRLMGEYRGNLQESANNGLLGDLFSNLPTLLGLVLLPLILVLCFRIMDLLTNRVPPKILLAFCVYFANCFVNGSWSTVLLSGGFLLACVLLYFFPEEEKRLL